MNGWWVLAALVTVVGVVAVPVLRSDGGPHSFLAGRPTGTSATTTSAVEGRVLDDELRVVPGASVEVAGANVSTAADSDGHYRLPRLRPGEYVLVASAPGHASAAAAVNVRWQETGRQDFFLAPRLTGVPFHETFPLRGILRCQLTLGEGTVDCGTEPSLASQETQVPFSVVEIQHQAVWSAQSQWSRHMVFSSRVTGRDASQEVARIDAVTGARIWILEPELRAHLGPEGGSVASSLAVGGNLFPGGAPAAVVPNPGFAFEQSFTLYTTLFHFGAPEGDFRVDPAT